VYDSPSVDTFDLVPLVVLFGYAVPAFVVFLASGARASGAQAARLATVPRSPYLPRVLIEYGYWVFLQPITICRWLGITPDLLSYASLVVNLAAAVCFGAGSFGLGGWTLLLAFALDAWDGMLARDRGTASLRGEFLDAVIDRYNDLIALLGLLYWYRNDPLPAAFTAAALIGSTLVSYTRAKGEACGVDAAGGFMQRHERAVYLGVFTLLSPVAATWLEPGAVHPRYHLTILMLALVAVATNVTAVLRARHVMERMR